MCMENLQGTFSKLLDQGVGSAEHFGELPRLLLGTGTMGGNVMLWSSDNGAHFRSLKSMGSSLPSPPGFEGPTPQRSLGPVGGAISQGVRPRAVGNFLGRMGSSRVVCTPEARGERKREPGRGRGVYVLRIPSPPCLAGSSDERLRGTS